MGSKLSHIAMIFTGSFITAFRLKCRIKVSIAKLHLWWTQSYTSMPIAHEGMEKSLGQMENASWLIALALINGKYGRKSTFLLILKNSMYIWACPPITHLPYETLADHFTFAIWCFSGGLTYNKTTKQIIGQNELVFNIFRPSQSMAVCGIYVYRKIDH